MSRRCRGVVGEEVSFRRNYHLVDDGREDAMAVKIVRHLKGIIRRLISISAFILYALAVPIVFNSCSGGSFVRTR